MSDRGWLQDVAKGEWWLPDKPDDRVPGVLVKRNDRFRLELIGEFPEDHQTMGVRRYPIICGFLAQGGLVSLLSCIGTKQLSVPGIITEQCSFGIAIKGHHFDSDSDVFDGLTGHCSGLLPWLNRSGLKISWQFPQNEHGEKEKAFEWSAVYRTPDPISLKWSDDIDFTLRVGVDGLTSGSHANRPISIKQICYVEARATQSTTIAALHESLHGLELLVRLLSGFPSQLTLIECESPRARRDNGRPEQLKLQFDLLLESKDVEAEALDWRDAFVPFPKIKHNFADVVSKWRVLREEQGEIIDAYFAGKDAKYFEERLTATANALQRLVESSHGRQKFELAISDPIRTYVSSSVAAVVIPLLTKTRHYLTHYNPQEREEAARGAELANLVDLVDSVVTCKLLELLGFDVEQVKLFIADNCRFNQRLAMNRWSDH